MQTPGSLAKEFRDFILKQNILALALAVVVGTALNGLVKSIVDGFIMPVVGVLTPKGDWEKITWSVGSVHFSIGAVLSALLNFVVIGLVAWRISKVFIRPEAPKPATKPCEFCRSTIDALATRCPNCTSSLVHQISDPTKAPSVQLTS